MGIKGDTRNLDYSPYRFGVKVSTTSAQRGAAVAARLLPPFAGCFPRQRRLG